MAKKIFRLKSLFEKIVFGLSPVLVVALGCVGLLNYDSAKKFILLSSGNLYPAVPVKLLVVASILAVSSISIIGMFIITRMILKPWYDLLRNIQLIKQGIPEPLIEIKSHDEIRKIAMTFNEMTTELKRYLAELQQKMDHIAALHELSEASSKRLDEEKILRIALTAGIKGLGFERGVLYLINQEEQVIEGKLSVGMTDFISEREIQKRHVPLYGTDILNEVVRHNHAYNVVDPAHDQRCDRQFMSETKTKAFCLVPIRTSERIIGIFSADNYFSSRLITDEQVGNLATFANTAGLAVENVRLYNELQTRYEELKILDKLKANFIANVTHELRTPLTPVKGYVDAIIDGTLGKVPEEQFKALKIVSANVNTVISRVNQLVDFALVEQKELKSEPQPFDLVKVMQDCADKIENQALDKGLKFYRFLSEDLLTVNGDPEQIEKVVDSLLHNAVKFTLEGYIALKIHRQGDQARIEITDTGIGIPGEETDKIFEKFYQVDGSTARKHSGMGIGLSLVKGILAEHNSNVEVSSKVGEGSTFTFTLSLAAGENDHTPL
ncbi:MAG: GAF domain-containing protein [Elusimicrobia bacterium]|nr:GAF domain-containing protein [Elusimicrobiota bacterium]